jgi:hypothetical protein
LEHVEPQRKLWNSIWSAVLNIRTPQYHCSHHNYTLLRPATIGSMARAKRREGFPSVFGRHDISHFGGARHGYNAEFGDGPTTMTASFARGSIGFTRTTIGETAVANQRRTRSCQRATFVIPRASHLNSRTKRLLTQASYAAFGAALFGIKVNSRNSHLSIRI